MNTNINFTLDESSYLNSDVRVKWCKDNLISYDNNEITYEIDNNNRLIIHGNIIICSEYGELPYKIDEVYGSVYLNNSIERTVGKMYSLKNMPTIIHGSFYISMNPEITSLENGPEEVSGVYRCSNCSLTSFKGIAKKAGSIIAFCNNINSLSDLNECEINYVINIDNNPVDIDNPIYKKLNIQHKIQF